VDTTSDLRNGNNNVRSTVVGRRRRAMAPDEDVVSWDNQHHLVNKYKIEFCEIQQNKSQDTRHTIGVLRGKNRFFLPVVPWRTKQWR
jgi:hypothetical protein